jgi:hypothetical protein
MLECLFEWLELILLVSRPQKQYSLHMRIGQNRLTPFFANLQTRYDGSPEILTRDIQEQRHNQKVQYTPQSIEDSDVVICSF